MLIDLKVLKKLSKIRILIVEDDELTAQAIEQSLKICCAKIYIANNGLTGYNIFETQEIDVVVSDINLPQMDGFEMIHAIQQRSPHLPIIIMTSYDTSEHILESINVGAYHFLRKPIRIEELQIALLMVTKHIYEERIILLEEFNYDIANKELYKNDKIVILTKFEKKLFHLLALNLNKTISYETIENYVWQDKSMSNEALRMCVKKIRSKTHYNLVQSISGIGYKMIDNIPNISK